MTGTDVRAHLRDFALGLPESYEEFPWGESVVKVARRIFLFLDSGAGHGPGGLSVKLPDSQAHALSLPGAVPTAYGLGRAGWVRIPSSGELPEMSVLEDWVAESYCAVAPKRLVRLLEQA